MRTLDRHQVDPLVTPRFGQARGPWDRRVDRPFFMCVPVHTGLRGRTQRMSLSLCPSRAPSSRELSCSQRTEMAPVSPQDCLLAHLRRTSRDLGTRASIRDRRVAVERIIATAVAAVPAAQVAGLTMDADHDLWTRESAAASVSGVLDALQGERGDGPAATVLAQAPADGTVVAEDFAGQDRDRWPEFAPRALEAGYRSMVSVLLEVEGAPRGTLNLYAGQPYAFDTQACRAAGILAMNAGMLLLGVEHIARLERAAASRDMIGRAQGMIMERFGLGEDAAFAKLVEASQYSNIKLVEVPRWLEREPRAPGNRPAVMGGEPCL